MEGGREGGVKKRRRKGKRKEGERERRGGREMLSHWNWTEEN